MDAYNHFDYGRQLAIALKAISHTPDNPRFFEAFGLEDLYNLDDKISSVVGSILIAVDGYESDSKDNGFDGLNDTRQYAFIVACSTAADHPETITAAFATCHDLCKQIRNRMLQDVTLRDVLSRNTQINGIGPLGDNFYGCLLSFTVEVNESFFVDETYWSDNG
jgi:hypothetical protein